MDILFYIIIASFLESLVALTGILFLFFGYDFFKKYLHYLISFAVGTFLAVVFFELLPESIEKLGVDIASYFMLGGFLFFFLLSRFLHWYHHHGECCSEHKDKKISGYLVLTGDFVHNFIDGIIIALAFMADVRIGMVTTVAVLAHEFPQEASDFFILIKSGFSRKKALLMNFLVSISTLVGAVMTFFLASSFDKVIGPALGIVAGNFLYIATADLIPELNGHKKGSTITQAILIILGIALIYLISGLVAH